MSLAVAAPPPSDEELVQFARSVLGDLADHLAESGALRETVVQARAFWQELYEIARSDEGSSEPGAASAEPPA